MVLEPTSKGLWGRPYKIASSTNCYYFLTIVDDFSQATWTFLLKHKSQVHHILATFFKMVNTQFQTSVKVVRSEFVNAQCKAIFNSLGIIHQTPCPYTPQQNGTVERKHKHILEIARALLFQSHLPKRFWGEAILAATYLINRLPSSVLAWKSPLEMLYHKPPNISHFRIFGCLCTATNVLLSKSKFDKRASKCAFLGYSQSQKAYKVYDLDTNTLFTSRDVAFHGHTFSFQASSTNSNPISLPLPVSDCESGNSSQDTSPSPPSTSQPSPVIQPAVPTCSNTHVPLRRSPRNTSKLSWLSDYVCHCISSEANHCIPSSYSAAHLSFVAQLSSSQEPKDYFQACKDKN
ncbi:UNVERIFIED_CONTAM: Copia protein [Sesamum latifolium]|uniref:Copia protein n=1 Tax=Sesamum latifolium TaxID=2727402 RepID=A0AAW2TPD0_9LAMI